MRRLIVYGVYCAFIWNKYMICQNFRNTFAFHHLCLRWHSKICSIRFRDGFHRESDGETRWLQFVNEHLTHPLTKERCVKPMLLFWIPTFEETRATSTFLGERGRLEERLLPTRAKLRHPFNKDMFLNVSSSLQYLEKIWKQANALNPEVLRISSVDERNKKARIDYRVLPS